MLSPILGTLFLLGATASCDGITPLSSASNMVDLEVSQVATTESPPENGLTSFVVRARNNGPLAVPEVVGGDTLSAGLEYVRHSTDPKGSYDPVSGIWTIGDLAPDEEVSLTIVARAMDGTAGTQQINTAGVIPGTADFADSDLSNNSSIAQVTVAAPTPPRDSTNQATDFLNEPAGFQPVTNRFWSDLTGDGWLYSGPNSTTGNYQSIVTLSGDDLPPVGGPTVLRAFYEEGTPGGYGTGRTYYSFGGGGLDEVFVGLWHKFDGDFIGSSISMKMFFFLFGGDRSFLGYEDRRDPDYSLGHAFNGFGSPTTGVDFDPLERLPYGEWYKLEWYWKRNSAPGVGDGILRVWMNGTLYMDLNDVEWPSSDMTMFYHEGTHGNTLEADMAWYVAQTYISAPPN